MKTFNRFAAIAVAAIALPAIALAQTQTPPANDQTAAPQAAPSATDTGANSAAAVPADQLPPAQANALAMGDNHTLSNGPVPDTAANRHKYGGPMSHAGKRTAPAGN